MGCLRLRAGSTLATCAARAGSLPSGCAGARGTSGKLVLQSGSSWNLPLSLFWDTCYCKFDLGWVTEAYLPSGSLNYQMEDTNHMQRCWLMGLPEAYKWIPFHEIREVGIWHFARNCCWYSEENIVSLLLGDLLFAWGARRTLSSWEVDAGLEQQLVTSLDFSTINKAILVPSIACCIMCLNTYAC